MLGSGGWFFFPNLFVEIKPQTEGSMKYDSMNFRRSAVQASKRKERRIVSDGALSLNPRG